MGRPGHRRTAVRIPHRARTRRCLRRRRRLVRTSHLRGVREADSRRLRPGARIPPGGQPRLAHDQYEPRRGDPLASFRPAVRQSLEGAGLPAMGLSGVQPRQRPFALGERGEIRRRSDGFQTHAGRSPRIRSRSGVRLDRSQQSRDHLVVRLLERQHAGEALLPGRISRDRKPGPYPGAGRCLPGGQRLSDRPSPVELRSAPALCRPGFALLQRHIP